MARLTKSKVLYMRVQRGIVHDIDMEICNRQVVARSPFRSSIRLQKLYSESLRVVSYLISSR